MGKWISNPKLLGSGIIECIPQTGRCPNNCPDCFFQSGRSYLEPLSENLPHIPTRAMAKDKIIRFNDGNDSNHQRELVEKTAKQYKDYFFNTSIPQDLGEFSAPVVLTLNPGEMTNRAFHMIYPIPKNLMFVRIRVNAVNRKDLVPSAIHYYTDLNVSVVLTFLAYYTQEIAEDYKQFYTWKQRTVNSYWCLNLETIREIEAEYKNNPLVYSCGYKNTYSCVRCGNCIRSYYETKERMECA